MFKRNQTLMFDYLLVFQYKYGLRKFLSSVFSKLQNEKIISLKLCKKVSLALAHKNLIPHSWLQKPVLDTPVNFTGKGPMLAILVNGTPTSCILDTGSTFTLIPFVLWQKLKINPNKLNFFVVYDINSASHKNPKGVLGSIELNLAIKTKEGDDQLITQKCLILKPELKLGIVLRRY